MINVKGGLIYYSHDQKIMFEAIICILLDMYR